MKSDLCKTIELSLIERKILLGLFLLPNFGFQKIMRLFQVYGDWAKIWNLKYYELKNLKFSEKLINQFLNHRQKINLDQEWNNYINKNIKIITFFDKEYPFLLKQIYSPPLVLFARGNLDLLNRKNFLSVVGSRKFTSYGKLVVQKFIKDIAENNITIVSGLAIGIDSLAHQESLNTNGSTIAVLGNSLDKIYPASNINLAKNIIKNGLIISETPINTAFSKANFAKRNRIIAGLSQASFIVEASDRSGALITANFALNENREVLTVPGSIFSETLKGNLQLIKNGAKIVENINDILEIYQKQGYEKKEKIEINFENEIQKIIYQIIENEPLHIDKIVECSKMETNVVISNLTQMELLNLLKNIGGQVYQVNK